MYDEPTPIEGEVVRAATERLPAVAEARDLAPAATVTLPISIDEAVKQWQEYQELTKRLLDETDYQGGSDGRAYKKKSAWRKYAKAFNVADRVTFEDIQRAQPGDGSNLPPGFPIYARIRVEVKQSTSGRLAEADHECHAGERCCPTAWGESCPKRAWDGHYCCSRGCSGRKHWSHPGDIPATALTRAKNRAISDLIGAGEVSAEELEMAGVPASARRQGKAKRGKAKEEKPTPKPRQGGAKAPDTSGDSLDSEEPQARARAFWAKALGELKVKRQAVLDIAGANWKAQDATPDELSALLVALERANAKPEPADAKPEKEQEES